MNVTILNNRFRFYAENHKAIQHIESERKQHAFFHMDIQDLQAAITQGIKLPCILLQTPEVEKTGGYDNMGENWDFSFVVFVKRENKTKAQMIAECKSISDQVFNMVMADVEQEILPSLVPGTSEGIIGPIGDKLYGWAKSMSLEDAYDGSLDPEQWLHL